VILAWRTTRPSRARKYRRLWQGLLLASVGGFAVFAIPGWVVSKLGADPDPIFAVARYAWVVLAWAALGLSLTWSAGEATTIEEEARRRRGLLANSGVFFALFVCVVWCVRWFIADETVPWSLPYRIGEFFLTPLPLI
jgi:hypothetical protein